MGRRRTVYFVFETNGAKKRATSKKDAISSARVLEQLHKDYPSMFPRVLKVVRQRQERISFGRVYAWGLIKEAKIKWRKSRKRRKKKR